MLEATASHEIYHHHRVRILIVSHLSPLSAAFVISEHLIQVTICYYVDLEKVKDNKISRQEVVPNAEFEPAPLRQEIITSKGGDINLKDEIGATLSIPIDCTAKDEQVNFAAGFRGSCEMPEGVESASPAYLIKTTNVVEFSEYICNCDIAAYL